MEAWLKIPEATVVATCDIRSERTHLAWEKTQCREYLDLEAMMAREQPDIVDICLPTYLHADYAVSAMKRGAHVLCEKPLSLREEDIIRCYRTAKETGMRIMAAQWCASGVCRPLAYFLMLITCILLGIIMNYPLWYIFA